MLSRQSRRLLQIGVLLLFYAYFDGFAIPYLGSPRIGLSVHTLSAYQAVLLLAQGLLWPRLTLGTAASWIAFWCSVHGALAILAAYTVAAVWGVGIETIMLMGELPHGLSRGTALQETFIKVLTYSSAPTGFVSLALILWGLRGEKVVARAGALMKFPRPPKDEAAPSPGAKNCARRAGATSNARASRAPRPPEIKLGNSRARLQRMPYRKVRRDRDQAHVL